MSQAGKGLGDKMKTVMQCDVKDINVLTCRDVSKNFIHVVVQAHTLPGLGCCSCAHIFRRLGHVHAVCTLDFYDS